MITAALRGPLTAALAALTGLLLLGAAPAPEMPGPPSTVDVDTVPEAAREWLPLIDELSATGCPELPPVWVVAQVEVESGWDAGRRADGAGGPAGLYQFAEDNWAAAGGAAWTTDPPGPGDAITDAETHLRVAVPWICTNLRAVTAHLEHTGKSADPFDAMLVCHFAGCGRVAGSATGVPEAGEASCSRPCAEVIHDYLSQVRAEVERFSAAPSGPGATSDTPAPDTPPDLPAPDPVTAEPSAWTGGATDCEMTDPTGDGCLTGATRHGLEAASAAFGGWSGGPHIRSAGCWDAHAWNPRSDHPRGKACDLFPGEPSTFVEGAPLQSGWEIADWFRTHAEPLRVKYLIWQGRYWDPDVADQDGWGRRYSGGGVYDTRNATGGHYDHIHVSFRE